MKLDDLKYAQRERLIFLDRCFTWRGLANRRDLIERFGISNGQAALDFKLYLEHVAKPAPQYDTVQKTYLAQTRHNPLFPTALQDAFKSVLSSLKLGLSDLLPGPVRSASPEIVAKLYRAMKGELAIHLQYTSMNTGSDHGQWIAPTAFSSDGEAVHIRGYSYKHREYRDYLPIRISDQSTFDTRALEEPLPFDRDWHTKALIWLRPISELSSEQAETVRREFGFQGETLCIETRKALEFYVDRRWGLNVKGARLERFKTDYQQLKYSDTKGNIGILYKPRKPAT
jgi:hypothetical protein